VTRKLERGIIALAFEHPLPGQPPTLGIRTAPNVTTSRAVGMLLDRALLEIAGRDPRLGDDAVRERARVLRPYVEEQGHHVTPTAAFRQVTGMRWSRFRTHLNSLESEGLLRGVPGKRRVRGRVVTAHYFPWITLD